MLEIIFIVALAIWLYNLAKTYNKPNKWLYPILAIATYLVTGVIAVLIATIIFSMLGMDLISEVPASLIGILAIPFAGGGVWLLHSLLKKAWSNQKMEQSETNEILDLDTLDD